MRDLVDLHPNGKTVGSKWLFKKNTDMDGVVHTYRARLVEKGFTQTYRVDYEETFSPVADIRAIRIPIAIAAFYDYVAGFSPRLQATNDWVQSEGQKSVRGRVNSQLRRIRCF
ncbi:putative retrotransposon ty1-copia subclass protein [Tanacetum coccineum]